MHSKEYSNNSLNILGIPLHKSWTEILSFYLKYSNLMSSLFCSGLIVILFHGNYPFKKNIKIYAIDSISSLKKASFPNNWFLLKKLKS